MAGTLRGQMVERIPEGSHLTRTHLGGVGVEHQLLADSAALRSARRCQATSSGLSAACPQDVEKQWSTLPSSE